MSIPGGNVGQMNVIGADGAETGQNLCKRSDNEILAMPENNQKRKYFIELFYVIV